MPDCWPHGPLSESSDDASYVIGLSYWWAISIVVVAMLLNSIIAEFEDRLPGGFLDPAKRGR